MIEDSARYVVRAGQLVEALYLALGIVNCGMALVIVLVCVSRHQDRREEVAVAISPLRRSPTRRRTVSIAFAIALYAALTLPVWFALVVAAVAINLDWRKAVSDRTIGTAAVLAIVALGLAAFLWKRLRSNGLPAKS